MFTGEQAVVKPKSDLYETSFKRYKFCRRFLKKNHIVLDISCGTGYGSYYLSKYTKKVIGVDINKKLIAENQNKYHHKKITFIEIRPEKLEKKLYNRFDCIISLETLEHCHNQKKFLIGLKKYVKKGGTVIISTPNNYLHINPPKNQYHHYEYDLIELYKILRNIFPTAKIHLYGQGKTTYKNNSQIPPIPIAKKLLNNIFSLVYNLDLKYFHVLEHINHFELYKRIGRLQKKTNNLIYSINQDSFFHPETSIFVIQNIKR